MPSVGETLLTSTGGWTNSPSSYAYEWRRDGVAIGGATTSTYLLVSADEGTIITVAVVATNAFGSSAPAVSLGEGPITASVESYLLLMSGGGDRLKLMNGTDDFLLMGAGIPAGAILDLNGDPILDTDGNYILEA
jgi:hypothetical protein